MQNVLVLKESIDMWWIVVIFVGGLLVILPKEKAADFCADILEQEDRPAWIVGSVVPGTRTAYIVDDVKITEVPETNWTAVTVVDRTKSCNVSFAARCLLCFSDLQFVTFTKCALFHLFHLFLSLFDKVSESSLIVVVRFIWQQQSQGCITPTDLSLY